MTQMSVLEENNRGDNRLEATEGTPPVRPLKTCIVMPAYHASKTIQATLDRLQPGSYDDIILVDDASTDNTAEVARNLGLRVHVHDANLGYGGNQKTCYRLALETDADVIVMLHPDNQYDGALIPYMVGFIAAGVVDVVLGSRILRRKDSLAGGMPSIKYFANRGLTILENVVFGFNLAEYHTGFRAFHRRVLEAANLDACSNNFIFDQQIIAQARVHDFKVGAVPVPTYYGPESSSISLASSARYAAQTVFVLSQYVMFKMGWRSQPLFLRRS